MARGQGRIVIIVSTGGRRLIGGRRRWKRRRTREEVEWKGRRLVKGSHWVRDGVEWASNRKGGKGSLAVREGGRQGREVTLME